MDGLEPPTRWFEASRSNPLSYMGEIGGLTGARTRSLRLKRTLLCLLSYQPDLSDLAFDDPAPSCRSCSSEHWVPMHDSNVRCNLQRVESYH